MPSYFLSWAILKARAKNMTIPLLAFWKNWCQQKLLLTFSDLYSCHTAYFFSDACVNCRMLLYLIWWHIWYWPILIHDWIYFHLYLSSQLEIQFLALHWHRFVPEIQFYFTVGQNNFGNIPIRIPISIPLFPSPWPWQEYHFL